MNQLQGPLSAMCGRLRVGKDFLHERRLGRCSHVFGLWVQQSGSWPGHSCRGFFFDYSSTLTKAAGSDVMSRRPSHLTPLSTLFVCRDDAMHNLDYIVLGCLIAVMLLSAAKAIPRRNS